MYIILFIPSESISGISGVTLVLSLLLLLDTDWLVLMSTVV